MPEDQKARRFEGGAHVAWMIDVDAGYRGASLREWTFREVSSVPGGRPAGVGKRATIEVHRLASDTGSLPEVTFEPVENARVRVEASTPLVVQGYGEPVARAAGKSVVVDYGSVLRAGPLLCAPLYAEQVESIHAGTMVLPFIGGGLEGSGRESAPGLAPEERAAALGMSKGRKILAAITVLIVSALGFGVWWALRPVPDQRRVLVAFEGWSDGAVGPLREQMAQPLRAAGFEVVFREGEACPAHVESVRQLEGCARSLYAHRILLIRLDVLSERPGLTDETPYREVRATSSVLSLWPGSEPVRRSVTFGGERAGGLDEALADFGRDMVSVLSHGVRADLVDGIAGKAFFSQAPADEREAIIKRRRAAEDARSQRDVVQRLYEQSCDRANGELASGELGPMKVSIASGPCDEEYPIAVAPDGSWVLVQVETIEPYYTFSVSSKVFGSHAPERIDRVSTASGERSTLLSAQNLLGLGDLAADAGSLFVVEKAQDRYGLVERSLDTGERRVVAVVEAPARIVSPDVSDDGEWAVVWYRPRRDADEAPWIVSVRDGTLRPLPPGMRSVGWVGLARPGQEAAETLLAAIVAPVGAEGAVEEDLSLQPQAASDLPPSARFRHVLLMDPSTLEVVARVGFEAGDVESLVGVSQGRLLVQVRHPIEVGLGPACSLEQWSPAGEALDPVPLARCLTRPALAEGGVVVGSAVVSIAEDRSRRDVELVAVGLDGRPETVLTANASHERYLVASPTTRRIAFGHVLRSHYRHIPRVAVLHGEIPR